MIVHPTYFSPVIQYVALANAEEIIFEAEDNYQKQTFRNRCYIYGANGKQLLTVPVLHTKKDGHQKTKDVKIDNSFSWQKLHKRSLETAYRSSPFFEFYEDEVIKIFQKKIDFLLDLNLETYQIISELLPLELTVRNTKVYKEEYSEKQDLRYLVNAKSKVNYHFETYQQVFADKHNFIPNLSILDLLFNEGPNALTYLEDHKKLIELNA
ncbi:MAG: WbqC family protein [Bacteroidota bacterium]